MSRAGAMFADLRQLQELFGPDAGRLYHQAAGENAAARAKYDQAMDTYFRANQAAAYDEHKKSEAEWDHFYQIPSDGPPGSTWGHFN